MRRIVILIIVSFFLSKGVYAGSEGQEELSKKKDTPVKDCFEGINRGIFAFNQGLDAVVFEPLAAGYKMLPSPVRKGTSNALSNISTLITIPNNLLQGDFDIAGKNTLRLLINSTIGILGLFDPASSLGFDDYEREDFGQTFGKWGIGEGCYLVLPVLGPSTLRDTLGIVTANVGGDPWHNLTVRNDTHYFSDFDYYASRVTDGIDFRAKNFDAINNLEKNSMDFYASVKSLYLQDRHRKILNADTTVETQDDSDWEEIENE
tara:strand:+ start:271 stop:1056 length:786 start_codon:yes stop_codon:yes gene_type:complete